METLVAGNRQLRQWVLPNGSAVVTENVSVIAVSFGALGSTRDVRGHART
jgi:hypothetical protein